MFCDMHVMLEKQNFMSTAYTGHTSQINLSSIIDNLCQPIRKNCLYLTITIYLKIIVQIIIYKASFQDHQMTNILFSLFQDHQMRHILFFFQD